MVQRPPALVGAGGHPRAPYESDDANVLGLGALASCSNIELDALTLLERLVTLALDVREMDEDVVTLLTRDEAEPLVCIEKLDGTLCHEKLVSHSL
jgi:hypothetical protein